MKCKNCNHIFSSGEMAYENSGNSPLCYPCAERGQMAGMMALLSCFIIALTIVSSVHYVLGHYCTWSDTYKERVRMENFEKQFDFLENL